MKAFVTILRAVILFLVFFISSVLSQETAGNKNYFELSLEELGQIQVSTGSLLSFEKKYSPSPVILISRDMINSSGARNLIEVLSAFIPGFQYLKHPALPDRIGMNGMISDLNDKMLFLVNGKIMNSQPLLGISSEIDLSMLGDIEKIEVVEGPGSATYGSGAINGVISIETQNSDNFSGLEISGRYGSVDKYYNAELKWAGKVPIGGNIYIYSGFDNYKGSALSNSPVFFGSSFKVKGTNINIQPETAVDIPLVNDHASDIKTRSKIFTEYKTGEFDIWARFTEGGSSGLRNGRSLLIQKGITEFPEKSKSTYRQFIAVMSYRYQPANDLSIQAQLLFDRMNNIWYLKLPSDYESGEKKYSGTLKATWNISANQSLAAGTEFIHGDYTGLLDAGLGATNFNWNTNYFAILAEHSWSFLPSWHSNISARIDKRTLTDYVFSPRFTLIYEPFSASCFALSWSRSNRLGDEYYNEYYRKLGIINSPGIEKVETYQFRFTQIVGQALVGQVLIHRTSQDILAWDHVKKIESMQGDINYYGMELLLNYRMDVVDLVFSHSYNKLLSMNLASNAVKTLITSQPYGYGNDFHMVPNHITKLNVNIKVQNNLNISAGLQKIWKYEGASDFVRYNREILKNAAYTLIDPNGDFTFNGPVNLNIGLIYSSPENWNVGLFTHNALGWFDKDLNKRRYFSSMDMYRDEAASFSIELKINI